MKNEALLPLVGKRVKVWQVGTETQYFTEIGVLECYEHPWLTVRTDAGDLVALSSYSVRMVRLAAAVVEDS